MGSWKHGRAQAGFGLIWPPCHALQVCQVNIWFTLNGGPTFFFDIALWPHIVSIFGKLTAFLASLGVLWLATGSSVKQVLDAIADFVSIFLSFDLLCVKELELGKVSMFGKCGERFRCTSWLLGSVSIS